jgi:prepilin-type N-terminal cleavage/methylation domain-containing protein
MDQKGFTLLELSITLLIIGIVGALLAPRLFSVQDSFKVTAAAEQIASHIRLAQELAKVRHPTTGTRTFGIGFDTTANLYSVYDQDGAAAKRPLRPGKDLIVDFDSQDSQYYESNLKEVNLSAADFGGSSQLTFTPLGDPSSGGSITLLRGSEYRYIGVAAGTGAVSVW